ncbi:MAG: signal peptide peptidase SppA [Porphyromonas sp.]|nr:signal peptide peptidase SppA [Porphyromonas sp.]
MKSFFKTVLASCLGVILASIVVFFLFFGFLGATIGSVIGSVTGSEKKAKSEVSLKKESVLLLDLEGTISEKPSSDIWSSVPFDSSPNRTFVLSEVLQAVDIARENPKLEAIVLDLEDAEMGFVAACEIRDALLRFKESGKAVYAFSDSYGTLNYYISSVADKIYASPTGSTHITGLASNTLFFRGLLEKLGVKMQVFKVGTFKGAVEPFMLDRLSPENRLQIETYIGGLWDGIKGEMAKARRIDPSVIQAYADEGHFWEFNDTAVEVQLVDSLVNTIDREEVLALKLTGDKEGKINTLRVDEALRLKRGSISTDGKIAVLYAEGEIVQVDPRDDNPLATASFITSKLVDELRKAGEDDSIDAVVLRVNSSGGALTTSEEIATEVRKLREKKPIVISMGNVAASGGYYISTLANSIVASPYTITGSIGIFGLIPDFSGTKKKLGVTNEVVKTAKMADMLDFTEPFDEDERAVMQNFVEEGYDLFLTRVSEGRNMTKEQVDAVGQGRVWLGLNAKELGLVDKLGGLQTAIDEAARLAELQSYKVTHKIERENPLKVLFGMNVESMVRTLSMSAAERQVWESLHQIKMASGVQAIPPYSIDINGTGEVSLAKEDLLPSLK